MRRISCSSAMAWQRMFGGEEVEIGLADRLAASCRPKLAVMALLIANEPAVRVLEIDVVREVVHERVEQVALLRQLARWRRSARRCVLGRGSPIRRGPCGASSSARLRSVKSCTSPMNILCPLKRISLIERSIGKRRAVLAPAAHFAADADDLGLAGAQVVGEIACRAAPGAARASTC